MAAKTGNADRVLAVLQKGQRCSAHIAKARWGFTIRQYQRAIEVLKGRGFAIDADLKVVTITNKDGHKQRVSLAVHQIVRNA